MTSSCSAEMVCDANEIVDQRLLLGVFLRFTLEIVLGQIMVENVLWNVEIFDWKIDHSAIRCKFTCCIFLSSTIFFWIFSSIGLVFWELCRFAFVFWQERSLCILGNTKRFLPRGFQAPQKVWNILGWLFLTFSCFILRLDLCCWFWNRQTFVRLFFHLSSSRILSQFFSFNLWWCHSTSLMSHTWERILRILWGSSISTWKIWMMGLSVV